MSLSRSIVYGTRSWPIEGQGDHTHKWKVFLRGFNDEDISYYIRKVSFKLHESFEEQIRVVESFPFEISETGWGEFELQIKIYLIDQRVLTINHFLKLHYEPTLELEEDCVVNEKYDEIIFSEMSIYKDLLDSHEESIPDEKSDRFKKFNKEKQNILKQIKNAHDKVKKEISEIEKQIEEFQQ